MVKVILPCGESVALRVLDMADVKRSRMPFTVDNRANTSQIPSSGDHAEVSRVETDRLEDFAAGDVQLDRVVDLDQGVRVPDGSAVVCYEEWHSLGSSLNSLNFAQFVLKQKLKIQCYHNN